jgi:protein gp37
MRFIDWGIVGGESGDHARPMFPAWARALRDQHVAAGKPFHFKQWGQWVPAGQISTAEAEALMNAGARQLDLLPDGSSREAAGGLPLSGHVRVIRVKSKKAAGRLLDGVEWNERPAARAA